MIAFGSWCLQVAPAVGELFRSRLSPHEVAAPWSELNAPEVLHEYEGAASRFLPHSGAMVHPRFMLSSAFCIGDDGGIVNNCCPGSLAKVLRFDARVLKPQMGV
jgi:hypothetical protein